MGRYEEALSDYTRALEIDPEDASYYMSRGQAYQMLGNKSMALADFRHAVALDPAYRVDVASIVEPDGPNEPETEVDDKPDK